MKKLVTVLLVALMVFALAACNSSSGKDDKLILGTSADYAPFEFIYLDDDGNQQYAGIDISPAKKIAEDMGKELEIVNMSF
jgi:polar amino acid transport system substrate-binding protein